MWSHQKGNVTTKIDTEILIIDIKKDAFVYGLFHLHNLYYIHHQLTE